MWTTSGTIPERIRRCTGCDSHYIPVSKKVSSQELQEIESFEATECMYLLIVCDSHVVDKITVSEHTHRVSLVVRLTQSML